MSVHQVQRSFYFIRYALMYLFRAFAFLFASSVRTVLRLRLAVIRFIFHLDIFCVRARPRKCECTRVRFCDDTKTLIRIECEDTVRSPLAVHQLFLFRLAYIFLHNFFELFVCADGCVFGVHLLRVSVCHFLLVSNTRLPFPLSKCTFGFVENELN